MNRENHPNDVPVYLFHQGNNAKAYEFLGAHRVDDGRVVFRVWAPNAVAVSVVGDFNGWNNDANHMHRLSDGSIWECFIENISQFDTYKFCITAKDGRRIFKADPYAFYGELRPSNASVFYDLEGFEWFVFGLFALFMCICIGVQTFDIIKCNTFPEKAVYDYLATQINNGG